MPKSKKNPVNVSSELSSTSVAQVNSIGSHKDGKNTAKALKVIKKQQEKEQNLSDLNDQCSKNKEWIAIEQEALKREEENLQLDIHQIPEPILAKENLIITKITIGIILLALPTD
jgi:hypothetical protein